MKNIVMTGVSSFSGFYFAELLLESGFSITGISNTSLKESNSKGQRIRHLKERYSKFAVMKSGNIGSLDDKEIHLTLLHGAHTTNRSNANFNLNLALSETLDIIDKLERLRGLKKIVFTGTFSEPYESVGDSPDSFNDYSTSKYMIYKELLNRFPGSKIGKFVMPNPIGIGQDRGILVDAIRNWKQEKVFEVRNPHYVRDWVPIELLAKSYRRFCMSILDEDVEANVSKPSLYASTTWNFLQIAAGYFQKNTNWKCGLRYPFQMSNSEPRIRINSDFLFEEYVEWNEFKWWTDYCQHYSETGSLNEEM